MNIALFLSSDGIALAHRQTAGHWAMIGETALDVPDLGASLAGLRALAVEREGDGFEALVVLPDDQILYTSLTAPTADPELTAYRIEDGLEGLTPYAVTELEYDWQALGEDRVKIAVVARETLDEARGFASQYGFTCKGFAAMPPMERFPGVPTFDLGASDVAAMGFSAEGIAFGLDSFGQPEPEAVAEPITEPEPKLAPVDEAVTPQEAPAPAPMPEVADTFAPETPEPEPEIPAAVAEAPATVAPAPPPPILPEPEVLDLEPPAPELPQTPVPENQNAALAEALQLARGAEVSVDANTPTPQAIDDPSVSGPITSIASDLEPDAPIPEISQEVVGDAGADDDSLPPAPSTAVLAARERARAGRNAPSAKAPASAPPPATPATDAPAQFTARRGPSSAPDGVGRPITAPSGSPGAVPGANPARGTLVGQRSSRLGLAHPDSPAPAAPAEAPTPDPQPAGDAAPMPRLAEQLQRVRNASKTRPVTTPVQPQPPRPRVEITPQPPTNATGASAPRRPSPFDEPAEATGSAAEKPRRLSGLLKRGNGSNPAAPPSDDAAEPGALGGLLRRRTKAPAAPEAEPDVTPGDETFAAGLLARKSVKPTGGSFKTGLVLTVILLLLLALVAIWSAVFLPNSPVARFFGVSDDAVATAPTGLQAPDVVSSAPVIGATGASDAVQPTLADEAAADGVELAEDDPSIVIETPVVADAPVTEVAAVEEEALPDIDAELDLPPLPAIDQGQNPSEEEAEALYAEDGIWTRSPDRPDLRPFDLLDRVYTASIDPEVSALDAVALPDPGVNPGETLRRFPPPPPFGTEYNLTEDGLVAPTPDGVVTPEGAFVITGAPPRLAVPRPREIAATAPDLDVNNVVLQTFRPAERPGDLSETRERQILGGLTQVELGERRPSVRPASPQEAAAQASLFPGGDGAADPDLDQDAVEAAVEQALQGTELAVAQSLLPRARPSNIAQIVASADRTPTEAPTAVAAAAVAAGPSIPSNADVSRAATERNAIRLRNVNLIGVSGSSSDRRALVRLASGRFVRVTVGDRLDGGRVAAIGETTLQYVRRGRTVTLEVPG